MLTPSVKVLHICTLVLLGHFQGGRPFHLAKIQSFFPVWGGPSASLVATLVIVLPSIELPVAIEVIVQNTTIIHQTIIKKRTNNKKA